MHAEMQRAGLIDEMMSDAMDSAMGMEDEEEETDAEVQRVLDEVAGEALAAMPRARARPVRGCLLHQGNCSPIHRCMKVASGRAASMIA